MWSFSHFFLYISYHFIGASYMLVSCMVGNTVLCNPFNFFIVHTYLLHFKSINIMKWFQFTCWKLRWILIPSEWPWCEPSRVGSAILGDGGTQAAFAYNVTAVWRNPRLSQGLSQSSFGLTVDKGCFVCRRDLVINLQYHVPFIPLNGGETSNRIKERLKYNGQSKTIRGESMSSS